MRKPNAGSASFSSRRSHEPTQDHRRESSATPRHAAPESARLGEEKEKPARPIPPARTGGGEWHVEAPPPRAASAPTAALSPDSAQAYAHPSTYEGPGPRERILLLQEKLQQRSDVLVSVAEPAGPPAEGEHSAALKRTRREPVWRRVARRHDKKKETSTALDRPRAAEPASFNERLAEKNAEKRRILLKRIGIVAAVVAILAGGVWAAGFSPLFALQSGKINVTLTTPSAYLQPEAVSAFVAGHEGESIATMNTAELAESLHTEIPLVASADISRSWPHGLTIRVEPSTPVACVVDGATCRAVDATGRDMKLENVDSLPHFAAGSTLDKESVQAGLSSLGALSEGTRARVAQVSVDRLGQITLQLADGPQVFWGTDEENEKKSQVLDLLLTRAASYYDVSSPSAPVSK